ncbi:hypothetical protein [Pseudomonas viridiflava]|nr:hypothetical protein [Pseudomonas viridiflava]
MDIDEAPGMQCVGFFDFFFARQSGIRNDALLFSGLYQESG